MADKKMLQGRAALTLVIPTGGVGRYVYSGALVDPDEVGELEAERLVDEQYLRWVTVGEDGTVRPDDAEGDAPAESAGAPAKAGNPHDGTLSDEPEVLARREAAKAKLPQDGSAPDGRASKDVWVEYAVTKGYSRSEVEKSDRDDIKALFKQ